MKSITRTNLNGIKGFIYLGGISIPNVYEAFIATFIPYTDQTRVYPQNNTKQLA